MQRSALCGNSRILDWDSQTMDPPSVVEFSYVSSERVRERSRDIRRTNHQSPQTTSVIELRLMKPKVAFRSSISYSLEHSHSTLIRLGWCHASLQEHLSSKAT